MVQDLNAHIEEFCPLLGQRVILSGLTTEALNGACGAAVDFGFTQRAGSDAWVSSSGRYTVRMDGPEGRTFKVKRENVRASK